MPDPWNGFDEGVLDEASFDEPEESDLALEQLPPIMKDLALGQDTESTLERYYPDFTEPASGLEQSSQFALDTPNIDIESKSSLSNNQNIEQGSEIAQNIEQNIDQAILQESSNEDDAGDSFLEGLVQVIEEINAEPTISSSPQEQVQRIILGDGEIITEEPENLEDEGTFIESTDPETGHKTTIWKNEDGTHAKTITDRQGNPISTERLEDEGTFIESTDPETGHKTTIRKNKGPTPISDWAERARQAAEPITPTSTTPQEGSGETTTEAEPPPQRSGLNRLEEVSDAAEAQPEQPVIQPAQEAEATDPHQQVDRSILADGEIVGEDKETLDDSFDKADLDGPDVVNQVLEQLPKPMRHAALGHDAGEVVGSLFESEGTITNESGAPIATLKFEPSITFPSDNQIKLELGNDRVTSELQGQYAGGLGLSGEIRFSELRDYPWTLVQGVEAIFKDETGNQVRVPVAGNRSSYYIDVPEGMSSSDLIDIVVTYEFEEKSYVSSVDGGTHPIFEIVEVTKESAEELISKYTEVLPGSGGALPTGGPPSITLNGDELAEDLVSRGVAGSELGIKVLRTMEDYSDKRAPYTIGFQGEQDDVCLAFLKSSTDDQIKAFAKDASGSRFLGLMIAELCDGATFPSETKEVERVISLAAQAQNELNLNLLSSQAEDRVEIITLTEGNFDYPGLAFGRGGQGHTAIAVGDRVYSFEWGGWEGHARSKSEYLDEIARDHGRSATGHILNLPSENIDYLKTVLEDKNNEFGLFLVEGVCSSATSFVLDNIFGTELNSTWNSPQQLITRLEDSNLVNSVNFYDPKETLKISDIDKNPK